MRKDIHIAVITFHIETLAVAVVGHLDPPDIAIDRRYHPPTGPATGTEIQSGMKTAFAELPETIGKVNPVFQGPDELAGCRPPGDETGQKPDKKKGQYRPRSDYPQIHS